jgi:hypothetical protein
VEHEVIDAAVSKHRFVPRPAPVRGLALDQRCATAL